MDSSEKKLNTSPMVQKMVGSLLTMYCNDNPLEILCFIETFFFDGRKLDPARSRIAQKLLKLAREEREPADILKFIRELFAMAEKARAPIFNPFPEFETERKIREDIEKKGIHRDPRDRVKIEDDIENPQE